MSKLKRLETDVQKDSLEKEVSLRDVIKAARTVEVDDGSGNVMRFDMELVERMAAQGMTLRQIAALFGVSATAIETRRELLAVLESAVDRGKALGIKRVSECLLEQASNGNIIAGIFYLKAVAGWREADKRPMDRNDEQSSGVKIYLPEKEQDGSD